MARRHHPRMNKPHQKSHKDYFVVSLSTLSGTRNILVHKSVKRALLTAGLLLVVVFTASLTWNYSSYTRMEILESKGARLENERARLTADNTRLTEEVAAQTEFTRTLQSDLGQIEQLLGLQHPPLSGAHKDLLARIDMVKLSANQEKILHRSIPNGFPIENRTITSKFGMRKHPVTGRMAMHKGIDLRTKGKVNVYATADGIVHRANFTKLSGNLVAVQHNFGFESYYAHLSKIYVQPGDIIRRGKLVGLSGSSGRHSVGPHLHYEVRYLGKPIDPYEFLHWELGSQQIFAKVKEVQWPSLINLVHQQIMRQTLRFSQRVPDSPALSR